jgi:cell division septation protein DedD
MDRRLKERLVGAAVLVAIGAWLIPWVLDGPEQSTLSATTALELPIPASNNPPMRAETIVL